MELSELIEQIARKVTERISDLENKPKLLILSEAHGASCHEIFENEALKQKYDVVCALMNEYQCDAGQYDVIVLRAVSNTALGKIAGGSADSPFTETAVKAILLGKPIFALEDDTELFRYRETAPKPYYDMMMQKIELLKSSGIRFYSGEQIVSRLLERETPRSDCGQCAGEPFCLEKRIITERDIHNLHERSIKQIRISRKTIVTDLAREYAERRGISFTVG